MDPLAEDSLGMYLLADSRFVSYYHPIIDLHNGGQPLAYEFLTRIQESEGVRSVGTLFHDTPDLDELGRLRLDLYCLRSTFSSLKAWDLPRNPLPPYVFLNMDPAFLDSELLWENLPGWIDGLPFHPGRLVFEITEGYLADLPRMLNLVSRLREFGVKVAVDDLGQGAASLTALSRIQPHFLKLDRSLIADAMPHQGNTIQNALIRALGIFAREAGIGLIAEGVETAEELVVVARSQIPYAQGFFFGQPQPVGA